MRILLVFYISDYSYFLCELYLQLIIDWKFIHQLWTFMVK